MCSSVARYREATLSEFRVRGRFAASAYGPSLKPSAYYFGVAATSSNTASPAALIPAASDSLTGDS